MTDWDRIPRRQASEDEMLAEINASEAAFNDKYKQQSEALDEHFDEILDREVDGHLIRSTKFTPAQLALLQSLQDTPEPKGRRT